MFTKGKKSPVQKVAEDAIHPQDRAEPPEPVFVKAGKRKHPGKVQSGVRKSGGPVGTIGQSASGQAVPGGVSTRSSVSQRKGTM